MTRLGKVRAKISEFMEVAPLDDREIPQNVDECLADAFASVHDTENRFIDPQSSLEKVRARQLAPSRSKTARLHYSSKSVRKTQKRGP